MKPLFTVFDAIKSLQPYAEFGLQNNDYDTLQWFDDESVVPKPTKEQVEAELLRLNQEYQRNEYQRLRLEEYPPFGEQFDMIFHEGLDAWKAKIQAIKDKYPKPE